MGRKVIQYLRVNNITLTGRMSTMTAAGSAFSVGASYTRGELIELRADVASFTGVGSQFQLIMARLSNSIIGTAKLLRTMEMICANAAGIDLATMEVAMFNAIGKGTSTITLMRGIEVKCEWLGTDTVTNARAVQIEFMGLSTPTNNVYGIYFEKESGTAAAGLKFIEIRLKSGECITSYPTTPNGVITAPKGSLCLVGDGSSASTRLFVNTDSSTTWVGITTAS